MLRYCTYSMNNKNNYFITASCLDMFENIPFLHRSNNVDIGAAYSRYSKPQKNAFLIITYGYINETVCEVNGKTYRIKSGEFLIKGRGSINHQSAGPDGSISYGIRVNPQFYKKYGICDDMVVHVKSDDKLKKLFLDFLHIHDQNGHSSSSETAMLQLLMYIDRNYKQYSQGLDDRGTLSDKQMEKVIKYINRNLFNKIHLADMAALFDVAPEHFSRLFKKTCGYSPVAYANFLRCDNAMEILLTTDFTPKEIVEACGFHSMSHFKNMYKKMTGRDALADASTVPVEIKVR